MLEGFRTERTFNICCNGTRAWSANVNYGVPRGAPPRKGMTLLCYGCLGGPFTPALFPRAGQELQASGHSNLPPRSGISGPNHFQMAVGPLRSSSSNGGASVPVSSRLRSWRVCADRGLWFGAKLCLPGTPPLPAQGPGSVLWGGCHWVAEDGCLAPWAADAQAQPLGPACSGSMAGGTTSSCFLCKWPPGQHILVVLDTAEGFRVWAWR